MGRFFEEQMMGILCKADRSPVALVAKKHGISEQTIYTWHQRFAGMSADDVKRLRLLEQESTRPKKILAKRNLEIEVMKAEPLMPKACSIPCVRRTLTNASSAVIFGALLLIMLKLKQFLMI